MSLTGRGLRAATAAAMVAGLALTHLPAQGYVRPSVRTQLDPTTADKQPAGGVVGSTSVSGDGRFVAFDSDAPDLVTGDNNNAADIFLRDNATGRVTLISRGVNGSPAAGVATCLTRLCYGSPSRFLPGAVPNPNYGAWDPAITASGRYVAFASSDINLVAGDTNAAVDVFVYDRVKASILRASLSSSGAQGNGSSWLPSVSADGRYVSFTSEASNLVTGDTNTYPDVFVRDLRTGKTERVSVSSAGGQTCATFLACTAPAVGGLLPYTHAYPQSSISGNGRYVEFNDQACGLTAVEATCGRHSTVFVHDMRTKTTVPVSVASGGAAAHYTPTLSGGPWGDGSTLTGPTYSNNFAASTTISDDGRYAAFVSTADNLVPSPAANPRDVYPGLAIYVRDLLTNRTNRVDVQSNGQPAMMHFPGQTTSDQPDSPAISGNGRYVAMGCTNCEVEAPQSQIQVYDRVTGQLSPVASVVSGARGSDARWNGDWFAAISPDGRHVSCTTYWTPTGTTRPFWTGASDGFVIDRGSALGVATVAATRQLRLSGHSALLARTATAGIADELLNAAVVYRPGRADLLFRLELPAAVASRGPDVTRHYGVGLTVGTSHYEVRAVATPGAQAVGLAAGSFGLYRQGAAGAWTRVATLTGSYMQTGADIVVALPLAALGAKAGAVLTDLQAFDRLALQP